MCINTCNLTLMKYLMPTTIFFSLREAHRDQKKEEGGYIFNCALKKLRWWQNVIRMNNYMYD